MQTVTVGPDGIKLGQLLKLAGLVESGGQAKLVLQAAAVTVNGAVETRRGVKLSAGDVVTFDRHTVCLVEK